MEQASKLNWAEDSQVFMHDQYEALKDFLIHTEDVRHQHVNLYFTFLAAVFGILGVVLSEVSPNVSRSWPILLGLATAGLLIGVYTYANVLQSRHVAFMLRAELDSLTFRWMRQRSDDVAYYHLRNLVKWIKCPTSKQGRPPQSRRWRMLRVMLTLLRRPGVWLRKAAHKVNQQRQLLFITFINSVSAGIFFWLLANPPHPLALPSGFLGYALELVQLGGAVAIAFVSGFVWIVQAFIYVRQSDLLRTLAEDKLRKAMAES